jgi:hypothetical protein
VGTVEKVMKGAEGGRRGRKRRKKTQNQSFSSSFPLENRSKTTQNNTLNPLTLKQVVTPDITTLTR